ncbi:proline-rich receptor-like protein kinase PERK1 [Heracleum sosnowskyi]|uniref:non-specific serine/threonine protein kinase n=1 Tax=Heracleum sosnowskyi TaxID=360622 RepID=A0AAD8HAW7_9APIA|nr:proline-rich receptor-like protein kinase PERK1 [Heracleum sosnowskyi]
MASSPENAPSGQANNNSTSNSSPPSNTPKSGSPPSPSPTKAPPPSPSSPKSPPPSPPPQNSPPPSPPASPPPSSQKSPPPSPPPSSPPPSPSSPPPSSPSPSSPPTSKNNNSPPPPPSSKTSPPPSSGEASSPPPPSSPPSTPNATPAPSKSDDAPSTIFSPPPAINAKSPGAPSLTSPPHLSPGSSDSLGDSSNHAAIIAAAASGGALVLAVVVVALLCVLRKRRRNVYIDSARRRHTGGPGEGTVEHVVKFPPPPGVMVPPRPGWGPLRSSPPSSNTNSPGFSDRHQLPISPLHIGKSQFTYDDLATATGGFSQAKILGQGGFGYVYKGVLPNGLEVAVKTLKSGSGQGDREFQAEVEIISRVHHRHLVSLVGYCMIKEQRMLVYEFVPNGTLEFHLHGKGQPVMDWKSRLGIAVGSAKGLAYLHEDCHPKIIHRDIKAANILLDNNFEAMVADFGLAKFTSDDITHVSTRVMGTFGYMAPEYASTGKLTDKSDVFSFGVMLLELITGRKPIDPTNKLMEDSLVDWARPRIAKALENGNYGELVDPRLEGNYDPQEMTHMISAAYSSIRYSAKMRPKMSQNVRTLKGDVDNERTKPGQSFGESVVYNTAAYNADMLKFRKMVMNSQEFPSSEFGDATDEYGPLSVHSGKDYHSVNSHNV